VNSAALAAVIAAATSVIVTAVSLFVGDRQQRRRERHGDRRDLDRRYLNPLRFHLVENHFRLTLLTRRPGDRRLAEFSRSIQRPEEVSGKDAAQGRERLITYREFCEHLTDPEWRAWVDGLIVFHLETARGEKEWRGHAILDASGELSAFLDECVGGGRSIESRLEAEELAPGP
jgi:hypothetical protein